MLSTRNPYPYPAYEGDDEFAGRTCTQQQPYQQPAHLAQREDPWHRLSFANTMSSARKEVYYNDRAEPRDSLDFALKTEYDQHKEFLKDRNETLLQKETLRKKSGSGASREVVGSTYVSHKAPGHPLRVIENARREHPYSVKTAISSHHTQTTNVGYSRKPDGGFYAS